MSASAAPAQSPLGLSLAESVRITTGGGPSAELPPYRVAECQWPPAAGTDSGTVTVALQNSVQMPVHDSEF